MDKVHLPSLRISTTSIKGCWSTSSERLEADHSYPKSYIQFISVIPDDSLSTSIPLAGPVEALTCGTLVLCSAQQIISRCYLKTPTLMERATSGLRCLTFSFSSDTTWAWERSACWLLKEKRCLKLVLNLSCKSISHPGWNLASTTA